jgi:hypothetical protein
MAKVQAKAGTVIFLFLATYQYNSDHHKASDPTHTAVGMNLLVPVTMKSQSYKHSSVHHFSTSANHEVSDLICTAVCMYLPTS